MAADKASASRQWRDRAPASVFFVAIGGLGVTRITAKALMVAQQGSKANMAPVLSKPCTSKGWPFVACMLGGPTRRCEHPHLTSHKFQNMAGQAVRFHNS